jgi:hypothetical protein
MPRFMYRRPPYSSTPEIERVEILDETEKTYLVRKPNRYPGLYGPKFHDERVKKQQRGHHPMFDTWELAHSALLASLRENIEIAKGYLEVEREALVKANSMQKPTE